MHNRTIRFVAAAAVLMATLLGIFLFQGTSSNLYAEATALLREARTLAYTLVTQANDGSDREIATEWLFKDPAYLRTETGGGHITVIDGLQDQQMSIVPENRTYMKGDFKVPRSSSESPFAAVAALRALPARADETLGIEQRDGHTVRGYRVTTGDASTTVWIDVDTRELVRAEQVYASAPGMNYVMKDICFDVDLDDGLFQLTPPDGYRLIVLDAGTGGSEAQFVEYLRVWATELAKDNTFPPVVLGPQMSKVMMDMAMQGKFHQEKLERLDAQEMYQALIWVAQLPKESNWRYLGDGVPYGDGQTPIFWYQPSGQADYRVVYADLSVREVLPEDLPN